MRHFCYLDIEATHTNWHDAEIIEIAFFIKDENGQDLDHFQSLIKPKNEITPEICQLTGIDNEMVKNAPEFHAIALRVLEKIQDSTIVAHKADFDFDLLQKELSKLELPLINKKLCTLDLSQRLIPGLKSYSLKALSYFLEIKLQGHHRAENDAFALYHLHTYLRLLNGEIHKKESFLPSHKKIIKNAPQFPGVIIIHNGFKKEVFKTENIYKKLIDLLSINSFNKERLSKHLSIKTLTFASLPRASLTHAKITKTFYPFCVYKVKNHQGRLELRLGKTTTKRTALYYFETKIEAKEWIKQITKNLGSSRLLYEDKENKNNFLQQNAKLEQEIRKNISLTKNILIRSSQKLNNKYQYTLIKKNLSYTTFRTEKELSNSRDINFEKLNFKKLSPREYMCFDHSLKWIKNQKTKTDFIFEIKST